MIIQGRDRKLSLSLDAQRTVAPARISRRQFSSAITSLAIGDFTGDDGLDLAALTEDGSIQVMQSKQAAGSMQQAAARPADWTAETLATGLKSAKAKLICARLSALSHETLVMMDGSEHQLRVWMDDNERRERNDETLAAAPNQHSEPVAFAVDDE